MTKIDFLSPGKGEIINIEDFPDEVISEKLMGDGFGIYLTDDVIVSPFDGEIKVVYPTGHAICIQSDDNVNIMIHIGIDSYAIKDMNKLYVKVGDCVKKGQKLVKTNVKKLKMATGNTATAVVLLNGESISNLKAGCSVNKLDYVADIMISNE